MADNGAKSAPRKRKGSDKFAAELAAGATVRDAAAIAGLSERTATRRWAEPATKAKVNRMRSELVASAVGRLARRAGEMVDVLMTIAADEHADHGARIRAADTALRHLGSLQGDSDIRSRLDVLEAEKGSNHARYT